VIPAHTHHFAAPTPTAALLRWAETERLPPQQVLTADRLVSGAGLPPDWGTPAAGLFRLGWLYTVQPAGGRQPITRVLARHICRLRGEHGAPGTGRRDPLVQALMAGVVAAPGGRDLERQIRSGLHVWLRRVPVERSIGVGAAEWGLKGSTLDRLAGLEPAEIRSRAARHIRRLEGSYWARWNVYILDYLHWPMALRPTLQSHTPGVKKTSRPTLLPGEITPIGGNMRARNQQNSGGSFTKVFGPTRIDTGDGQMKGYNLAISSGGSSVKTLQYFIPSYS